AAALAFNRRAREGSEERARDLLKAFDLWDKRHEPAGNLSGGQQRILEIVRALMTRPRLLLLDEPTAGLNPLFIAKLKDILLDMKSEGTSTLIVEHNMRVVVDFCERVVAMSEGQIIAEGVPTEVLISPAVIDSYLGR
ncbi:MAG: ATP-binding cassette domain-containing protein, partial [Aigarchaeota archaeon]|nr:ATP-binding cassette domain-containing protein [Aigarchaeota archaeon]